MAHLADVAGAGELPGPTRYPQTGLRPRMRGRLRSAAEYQFGPETLMNEVVSVSGALRLADAA